jgi:nucleoid-associated protein YgaU
MSTPDMNESPADRAKRLAAEASKKAAVKIIGEHVVKEGETLTHIAQKYYGSTEKPFWEYLYEFNKHVIGPDMKLMKPGMKLKVPELSPELQAKKQK